MNTERLTQLSRVMREVGGEQKPLYMAHWYTKCATKIICGTASCALGWASRDTWMQSQGLQPFWCATDKLFCPVFFDNSFDCHPETDRFPCYDAGSKFFDIPRKMTRYLFDPSQYTDPLNITPQDVIQRITEILATKG